MATKRRNLWGLVVIAAIFLLLFAGYWLTRQRPEGSAQNPAGSAIVKQRIINLNKGK